MQARKSMDYVRDRTQNSPPQDGGDPRQLRAMDAVRPVAPRPPSERLPGPLRLKASYLERRSWPFSGQA